MKTAYKLAERHGCDIRQIQKDRTAILAAWTKEAQSEPVEQARARIVEEIRASRRRCFQMGDTGPIVGLHALEAKITGVLVDRVELSGTVHLEAKAREHAARLMVDLPPEAVEVLATRAAARRIEAK